MDNRPIGIMDSGVGGLTVRMEIKQRKKSRHWRRPFGITC